MQTHLEKPNTILQAPRIRHAYVCSCIYEPDKDLGKYFPLTVRGKQRVMLEPIALTIFRCPKCGAMYVVSGFRVEEYPVLHYKKVRTERVQVLKRMYHGEDKT